MKRLQISSLFYFATFRTLQTLLNKSIVVGRGGMGMSYGYDPLQSRRDMLNQQRQLIDQQLQSLNQMSVPPININNNMTPPVPMSNFDFNGKWVDSEEQAKQVANNNLPLILFDNNQNMFYMKSVDGSFKKFKFEEVVDVPVQTPVVDSRVDELERKMDMILSALQTPNKQTDTNTQVNAEMSVTEPKTNARGGNRNGKQS